MKIDYRIALFVLFIFWDMIFFSLCSILGVRYGVDETPPFYTAGFFLLLVLTIIALGRSIFSLIRDNLLFTVVLPLFITICFLFDSAYSQLSLVQYFIYYVAFSIPSSYIGVYLARNGGIAQIGKWLDIVMIICSLGVLQALPGIIYDSVITMGGTSYQRLAYMSGFAFCTNVCGIFLGDNYERFSFMQSKAGKLLSIVLLIVQLLGCLYSGGRGGFLYLAITSIFLFVYSNRTRNIFYIVITIILLYYLLTRFQGTIFYDVIGRRMERTFNYITDEGGIDIQNRNDVWSYSISMIYNNDSIWGIGLFKYYSEMKRITDFPYAHNLFLDLMLQGGIIYFLFWIAILFHFFKCLFQLLWKTKKQVIIVPIVLYVFIELMFSGTYLWVGLFWLSLSFVISYKKYFYKEYKRISDNPTSR